MNKKHIVYLLLALPLLLTSCLKDQEDTFDKSSSARVTEYLANAKKVLTSAENGWVFNYFPDSEQSYGGYAYVVKFDDENVTAYYEQGDTTMTGETVNYTAETSTYILKNEDGPVIMFDTYSNYLHAWATPAGDSGPGGYQAYDGDFIFIIMDISEDGNTIKLKGNRSGNILYMYRNTVTPNEYMQKVIDIEESMTSKYYSITEGESSARAKLAEGIVTVSYNDTTVSTAYVFTSEGISFYEPVEIFGKEASGIQYVKNSTSYPSPEGTLTFNEMTPPLNEQFTEGDWFLCYSGLGEYGKGCWNTISTVQSSILQETLNLVALTTANDVWGLYFNSGGYAGLLGLDYEYIGDDEITLTYKAALNQGNGTWYMNNGYYRYLVMPLSYSASKTFKLTADNLENPSEITLTDESDATNTITVYSSYITSPLDK